MAVGPAQLKAPGSRLSPALPADVQFFPFCAVTVTSALEQLPALGPWGFQLGKKEVRQPSEREMGVQRRNSPPARGWEGSQGAFSLGSEGRAGVEGREGERRRESGRVCDSQAARKGCLRVGEGQELHVAAARDVSVRRGERRECRSGGSAGAEGVQEREGGPSALCARPGPCPLSMADCGQQGLPSRRALVVVSFLPCTGISPTPPHPAGVMSERLDARTLTAFPLPLDGAPNSTRASKALPGPADLP